MTEPEKIPEFLVIRGEGLRQMTPGQYRTLTKSMQTIGIEFVPEDEIEVIRKTPKIPEDFEVDCESPYLKRVEIAGEEVALVSYSTIHDFLRAKGIMGNKFGSLVYAMKELTRELSNGESRGSYPPDSSPQMISDEVALISSWRKKDGWNRGFDRSGVEFGIIPPAFVREVRRALEGERKLYGVGPSNASYLSLYVKNIAKTP